jgi:hypothetical protein
MESPAIEDKSFKPQNFFMNPRTYRLNVLAFLKDFNGQHHNLLNQVPGRSSWLAALFCFSSGSGIGTIRKKNLTEENNVPLQKYSATENCCRVYSILGLSLIECSRRLTLPGTHLNQGGGLFSPLTN